MKNFENGENAYYLGRWVSGQVGNNSAVRHLMVWMGTSRIKSFLRAFWGYWFDFGRVAQIFNEYCVK